MTRQQRRRRDKFKDAVVPARIGEEPPKGYRQCKAGKHWFRVGVYKRGGCQGCLRESRKPVASSSVAPHTSADILRQALREKREREQRIAEARRLSVITEELARLKARDSFFDALTGQRPPPVLPRERTSGLREGLPVALLSDVHPETRVRPDDTPLGNAYNLAIADHRLKRYFRGVEWAIANQQSAFKMRELLLWLGGDMITNHLHDENVETAQLGPAPATLWVQERIISGLNYLLNSKTLRLERIHVLCSVGNHGRTTKTMRATTAADHSWEWLMYQAIAQYYSLKGEKRISVYADRAQHQFFEAYGYRLHFHHGHQVRYLGGTGGVLTPFNKAVDNWDKVSACDYHHFGHYHTYLDSGNILVNGSVIGYDGYAMSQKCKPEAPQQAFYVLDSKRGKSVRFPIWVSEPQKESELWTP